MIERKPLAPVFRSKATSAIAFSAPGVMAKSALSMLKSACKN